MESMTKYDQLKTYNDTSASAEEEDSLATGRLAVAANATMTTEMEQIQDSSTKCGSSEEIVYSKRNLVLFVTLILIIGTA